MADSGPTPEAGSDTEAAPILSVRAQYMVDLSFENPAAPASLAPRETPPQVSIGADVNVRRGSDSQFEVILKLAARAQSGEETIFAIELVYAGIFLVQNIPEPNLQPVLFIECPRILFPFARRIIADLTRDGGFPPLMIEPIDFVGLYQSQLAAARQDEAQPKYDA